MAVNAHSSVFILMLATPLQQGFMIIFSAAVNLYASATSLKACDTKYSQSKLSYNIVLAFVILFMQRCRICAVFKDCGSTPANQLL